ncbi:hypothetical protein HKD37_08G021378 [Glycine soja]
MGAGKGAVWFSNAVALVAIAVVACHAQPSATFKCSSANKPTCRPLISYSNPNTTTLGDIQKLFNVKHIMDIVGANNATKKIYGGPQRGCEVLLNMYLVCVFRLQCEPSQLKPTNWSSCPSLECSSNVIPSTDSCNRTTCAYTGYYTFRNISAEVVTENTTCAVPPSGSGGSTGSDSGASRSTFQGLLLSNLLIVIHFVLFLVYVL